MPAYAYSITINREAKTIRYNRTIDIDDDVLTLSQLKKIVTENESFSVVEKENSIYGSSFFLSISGERLETNEELKERIEKEEKYMEEYNKRRKKG